MEHLLAKFYMAVSTGILLLTFAGLADAANCPPGKACVTGVVHAAGDGRNRPPPPPPLVAALDVLQFDGGRLGAHGEKRIVLLAAEIVRLGQPGTVVVYFLIAADGGLRGTEAQEQACSRVRVLLKALVAAGVAAQNLDIGAVGYGLVPPEDCGGSGAPPFPKSTAPKVQK